MFQGDYQLASLGDVLGFCVNGVAEDIEAGLLNSAVVGGIKNTETERAGGKDWGRVPKEHAQRCQRCRGYTEIFCHAAIAVEMLAAACLVRDKIIVDQLMQMAVVRLSGR